MKKEFLNSYHPQGKARGNKPKSSRVLLTYHCNCSLNGRFLIKHISQGWPFVRLQRVGTIFALSLCHALEHQHLSDEGIYTCLVSQFLHLVFYFLITWLWWPRRLAFLSSLGLQQSDRWFLGGYHPQSIAETAD